MRTIKFRGLVKFDDDCDIKRWAYGDKCTVQGKTYIILDDAEIEHAMGQLLTGFVEVHPDTVGQYTGLKDKNGEKDVYGGDKIRGEYACLFETHVVEGFVFYDESEVMWMLETPSESIALSEIEQFEIIGTIHDKEKPD